MKFIKYFVAVASAVLLFASCGDDSRDYSNSNTEPSTAAGVEFSSSTATSYEVDPDDPTFQLTVVRKATDAASYDIKVVENQDESFEVPSKVEFAQGETSKDITVKVKSSATMGTALALTLTFNDADINPYTGGIKTLYASCTVIKWESAGTGVWEGNIINTFFNVNPMPMSVTLEKATTASSVKYRFASPYTLCTAQDDELGYYYGYPYAEETDVTENGGKFVITIDKNGASLAPVNLGMNFGYGEISIGSVYGNVSGATLSSYPLGVYKQTETGGTVTFAAKSLYISMAEYEDGGKSPCSAGETVLYLSTDDYAASLK